MKVSNAFENTIKTHLDGLAAKDPLFAKTLENPKKNISDCCTYILNQVKKSGINGFEDSEIFGMAVHYYDEENIEVGAKINAGHVVVNHVVELTEEEKKAAKDAAFNKVVQAEQEKLKKAPAKKPVPAAAQTSLF